jgi:hypothetical protein
MPLYYVSTKDFYVSVNEPGCRKIGHYPPMVVDANQKRKDHYRLPCWLNELALFAGAGGGILGGKAAWMANRLRC